MSTKRKSPRRREPRRGNGKQATERAESQASASSPAPAHPPAERALEATIRDTDPPARAFSATPKQIAYLWAMSDALLPHGDKQVHDTAMAEKLKMSRQTIWEWKQDPQFQAWIRAELGTEQETFKWFQVLETHYNQAIRGSVRSAEFLARVRTVGIKGGGFTSEGADVTVDNSVSNYQVNLLVPRPDDPALKALPAGKEAA
jgi:hypothetical protein